jgi:protein O-mannosyl-transferase
VPNLPSTCASDRTTTPPLSRRFAASWRSDWVRVFFLIFIGVLARTPALSGVLIWDDRYLAQDNPFIKSPIFVWEVFRHHLFLDSFSAHYRPVQNLSFIADYLLWNGNTYGLHLTNVALHVGSGVLLYLLLKRLFPMAVERTIGPVESRSQTIFVLAFFVALLWTVHPVHSAAVDYISGRADSLAFLFAGGGWLLFLRGRIVRQRTTRWLFFALAVFAALLSSCSRETGILWLLIFLLFHLFFEPKPTRRAKVAAALGCICVLGCYLILRQLPGPREAPAPSNQWSRPMRAVLMLRALGDYGRLMIFPSNLHMERTVVASQIYLSKKDWEHSVATEYLSIAGFGLLALFGLACARRGVGQRLRIFGAAWFLIAYLPTSNLYDLNATVAEHWLYLPSVGLLIFLAGCVVDLPVRARRGLIAIGSCAVVALAMRSGVRSSDWVSPAIFYERTIAAGGTSMRVSVNLGQIYSDRGDYARAEKMFRGVLRVFPDYPIARNNLAHALERQGKTKEAEALFTLSTQSAIVTRKEYPRTWIAAVNLSRVQHEQNNDKCALATLEKARVDYPHTWEIISFEAELLRQAKGFDAALRLVEGFASDHWWHYGAFVALGRLYAEKGDVPRAEVALRHASWLDVHDADALRLIALINLRQNRLQDAYRVQRRAVARQPDQPQQYVLLSNILEKMGRPVEAKLAIIEGTRLQNAARQTAALAN